MHYSQLGQGGSATFFYPEPHHHAVSVTGSFCGWRAPGLPLERVDGGFLGQASGVGPGPVEYKFIVDGRWVDDPLNLVRRGDGRGGHNSLLPQGSSSWSCHALSFWSPSLGEQRGYAVALPPGYERGDRRYPTLYLLHGALDWERTWVERGALLEAAEGLLREGAIGPMIIVMPRDNGGLHGGDGRVAEYLARDVVGHVDHEFRTLAEPRRRGLDGLSTGGFTSLVLGALRPDVYRSIGTMSGSHDGRSFEAVRSRAESLRQAEQRYLVSCGLHEPHIDDSRAIAHELGSRGVSVAWADTPGGHDWPVWKALLATHLRFHAGQLGGLAGRPRPARARGERQR